MAYHLYHTEGLVLGERAYGEANKIYYILTPDLGLIAVLAQGIRHLQSKLKFHLDKFAHIKLVVVRGRELWRLTNAEKVNDLDGIYKNPAKLKQLAKVFSVLNHLIQGEEKAEELFVEVKRSLEFLADLKQPAKNEKPLLINWEYVVLLRLLKHLGYLKQESSLMEFIESEQWDQAMVAKMTREKRILATKLINSSLLHSHI
ncbi:MAG: DNA repair protein RecO [Patescibacteria group bacterium]